MFVRESLFSVESSYLLAGVTRQAEAEECQAVDDETRHDDVHHVELWPSTEGDGHRDVTEVAVVFHRLGDVPLHVDDVPLPVLFSVVGLVRERGRSRQNPP